MLQIVSAKLLSGHFSNHSSLSTLLAKRCAAAMLKTLVTELLFLNLLLASPIQKPLEKRCISNRTGTVQLEEVYKRGMQSCHKDSDCGKNECCITVFGVHECSQRPALGEPCSPSKESVEFTSCPCQKDNVCIQGSLFAFVGGRCY